MAAGFPITDLQRSQILTMRSDGYTIAQTALAVHLSWTSVARIAPGRIGKVPNDRLREAFLASPVSAADVARYLGWSCGHGADTSRVKRTLGLISDINGAKRRSTRHLIDWETGSLIAEAIGVAAWSVLDDTQVAPEGWCATCERVVGDEGCPACGESANTPPQLEGEVEAA